MDTSILNILTPIANAIGVSIDWINATAVNVMLGTGLIKQAFGIKKYWNFVPAGLIALAMGFAAYPSAPVVALVGAALIFAATSVTMALTGLLADKVSAGIKARGEAERGPEPRG